jgi:hypothetical protein
MRNPREVTEAERQALWASVSLAETPASLAGRGTTAGVGGRGPGVGGRGPGAGGWGPRVGNRAGKKTCRQQSPRKKDVTPGIVVEKRHWVE